MWPGFNFPGFKPHPSRSSASTSHRHLSTEKTLSRGQHTSEDVAKAIIGYANRRGNDLKPRQKAALERFRTNDIFRPTNTMFHVERQIKVYYNFFDDMFFGGLLKTQCAIIIEPNLSPLLLGLTVGEGIILGANPKEARVTVYVRKLLIPEQGRHPRELMLSTLLHEMIHAFLQCYSCFDPACFMKYSQAGRSGHGFAFQDAAYALEHAVSDKTHMNLPLDTLRLQSLVLEMSEHGYPRINVGRWGFTDHEFQSKRNELMMGGLALGDASCSTCRPRFR